MALLYLSFINYVLPSAGRDAMLIRCFSDWSLGGRVWYWFHCDVEPCRGPILKIPFPPHLSLIRSAIWPLTCDIDLGLTFPLFLCRRSPSSASEKLLLAIRWRVNAEHLWWVWGCIQLHPHAVSWALPFWLPLWSETRSRVMRRQNRPDWERWSAS